MSGTTTSTDTRLTTSTTSTSLTSGSGFPLPGTPPPPSIVFNPPPPGARAALKAAADGEDETVRSLRRMGIRAPKPYEPQRELNFDALLARVVFHMSISKIPANKSTSSLRLLFDTDSFEAAHHLGMQDNTDFDIVKEKLKAYFTIKKALEKLKTNSDFAVKKPAKRSKHLRAI